MQRLEVSGAVRPTYGSLGVKRLKTYFRISKIVTGGGKKFYITEERNQIPPINRRGYIVTDIGYGQFSKGQQPKKTSANSSNINCGFT